MTTYSYSRLERYRRCPLSYYLHYVAEEPSLPTVPMLLGQMVHRVLERLTREKRVEIESIGRAIKDVWAEKDQHLWTPQWSGLLAEAERMIRGFVEEWQTEHRRYDDVDGIERSFAVQVGDVEVIGVMDRIDRNVLGDVLVVDYKTGLAIPSRADVESDLQLSIYDIAAREMYPGYDVSLVLHLLRHGIRMRTERTAEQRDETTRTVETLVECIERDCLWSPVIQPGCVHCDHRDQCPEYCAVLDLSTVDGSLPVTNDVETLSAYRERVAAWLKILQKRKRECDATLREHMESRGGRLATASATYSVGKTSRRYYPVTRAISALSEVTGQTHSWLISQVCEVNLRAMDEVVSSLPEEQQVAARAALQEINEPRQFERFNARRKKVSG